MNQIYKKEERQLVCQQIARFFYTSAIPFNCVNNPVFERTVDDFPMDDVGASNNFDENVEEECHFEGNVELSNKELDLDD